MYSSDRSPVDALLKLRQEVKAGELRPVYVFYMKSGEREKGTVEFLVSMLTAAIADRFKRDPAAKFNIDSFNAPETDIHQALGTARTLPMFGGKRLIMFRSASPLNDKDAEKILPVIENPPDSATMVLSLMTFKLPAKFVKRIQKAGCGFRITSFGDRSVPRWISGIFREENIKISGDAVATLADCAGTDLQAIEDARDKLVLYTMGRKGIESTDVEELLMSSRSADIFQLADALWDRNAGRALNVLAQLEASRTDALFINTLLAMQIRSLIRVKRLSSGRPMSPADMASAVGIRDFLARKYIANVRKFTLVELENALAACAQMNEKLKSSRMNAYRIVEKYALKMISLQV
ncbi:MAG: DNA polymerase III subunit delta [Pseudomonadota bacterium]